MTDEIVSYDTENPVPRAEVAPRQVRYTEMKAWLLRCQIRAEGTCEAYKRAAAEASTPAEREACLRFAARAADEAEVSAGTWRVLQLIQGNHWLRAKVREAAAAESGAEIEPDLVRYD